MFFGLRRNKKKDKCFYTNRTFLLQTFEFRVFPDMCPYLHFFLQYMSIPGVLDQRLDGENIN